MTLFKAHWLRLVAIIFVLGALYPHFPYAYYQFMDWVVAGAAVAGAFHAKRVGQELAMWVMVLIAVIFNPIAPLYLRADLWQIADILVAIIFAGSLFFLRRE